MCDQIYCHNSKNLRNSKIHPEIWVIKKHMATQPKEIQYELTEFREEMDKKNKGIPEVRPRQQEQREHELP